MHCESRSLGYFLMFLALDWGSLAVVILVDYRTCFQASHCLAKVESSSSRNQPLNHLNPIELGECLHLMLVLIDFHCFGESDP